MTEKPDHRQKPASGASEGNDVAGEFFSVGAPLHPVRPGYIARDADELLFSSLSAGQYAYVIAPDRAGKSSLIAATSARLQHNGVKVAVIDLAQIGERDGGTDPGRWYYSIAYRILRQLRLKVDLQNWWHDKSMLSNRQRLVEFYIEIVLQHIEEQVVIFIDELQCIEQLSFGGDLLASIRAAHNARTTDHDLTRLSFALVCECDSSSLVDDERLSPFAVSREIRLGDFNREDLNVFATELNLSADDAALALDRIFFWTSGQPHLTQKLARAVSRENIVSDVAGNVDRIARQQLAGRAALHSEPHMSHLHRQIVRDKKHFEGLLNLYGKIRKGIEVAVDRDSNIHRRLLASGLVVADEDEKFRIRNRTYRRVFTSRWANENLPMHWKVPAAVLALMAVIAAIPFSYTQLLPKPYMKVIFSPGLELSAVHEAYGNLRSFPGHARSADRVFSNVLARRAEAAQEPAEMQEIQSYASMIPESGSLGDRLFAEFWDRQVVRAIRDENRDKALVASLESLLASTPTRRRIAASLVGEDYRHLVAGISAAAHDRLVFNPEHMLVSFFNGPEVSQWALAGDSMQEREIWTVSALEVSPLVRRVVVDRPGTVRRVGLTVNVGHGRLDDLKLKLIAPSGRTAELAFRKAASFENEEIRFPDSDLEALLGEPVNGTWSLSLRDEVPGVTGHLIGWDLRLDSQVVVENFQRGLDIPDPVARQSDDIWLSEDGRYAVARAQQSDSARIWDLAFAQPLRTISMPASETVIGISADAEYLLTASQDSVNRWRVVNGRRAGSLEIGAVSADAILSRDGNNLFVLHQQDLETSVELWSVASREKLASIAVAGDLALVAIDSDGQHVAIADYDRAVRIWNFRKNELLSQIDLPAQPTSIQLSATGDTLAVVHGEQGVSLWAVDSPARPLLHEIDRATWAARFSPSGNRVMIGNSRTGYQIYRSADGGLSGPLLDSGLQRGPQSLLAFSGDENYALTSRAGEHVRVWRVPATEISTATDGDIRADSDPLNPGDITSAISPDARWLAVGDSRGHLHILEGDVSRRSGTAMDEQLSYLGHNGAIVNVVFSGDSRLAASAGFDGSVRIWETDTGLPRDFFGGTTTSTVGRMMFSPSAQLLAVLSGLHVWIMNTDTGAVVADAQLGEAQSDMAFADDFSLYIASESGVLRRLTIGQAGGFTMSNVWTSTTALRRIELSPNGQFLVVVDAANTAQVLNLRDGQIGRMHLELPDSVGDIRFSPGDLNVLFKTGRWIHRASVSHAGLIWLGAMPAPKTLAGSRMAFAPGSSRTNSGVTDSTAQRVMLLTRNDGMLEVSALDFTYGEGAALIGNKDDLLQQWRARLLLPEAKPADELVSEPLM